MRRRLYFVVPDVTTTHKIVNELLLARVDAEHMHVVAKEGTPLGDIPEANILQKTDLIEAAERGLAVGGVTGALAGLLAVTFPPAGVILGGGMVAASMLAGAGFGAWVSSMIGINLPNRELKAYEAAVKSGAVLMMVDVAKDRVHEIERLVQEHHPEAQIGGTEPHIPAFP
ncbi:MAG: DUF1269 domain-containing protein [Nevskiales bacterium]